MAEEKKQLLDLSNQTVTPTVPTRSLRGENTEGLPEYWVKPVQAPDNWKHFKKYMPHVSGAYDVDKVKWAAARRQSNFDRNIAFVPRMLSTATMEALRFVPNTIAGISGASVGAFNHFFTDKEFGETIADYINNPVTEFLYNLEEDMKSDIPVLYRDDFAEKSWWKQVWSSEFFGDEFAQGVGFFAGNLIPAFVSRGASLRFAGMRAMSPARLTARMSKLNRMRVGQALNKPTLNILTDKAKANSLMVFTTAQSMSEAAAETYFSMETLRADLEDKMLKGEKNPKTGKPYTEDDIKQMEGKLAASIWSKNMGLLMFTNHFMNKMIFSRGFNSQKFQAVVKNSMKDAKWYQTIGRPLSKVGQGVINEGFIEEGMQTAFEQHDVHAIMSGNFDFLNSIHQLPSSYISMLNTKEGAKAVWIGALLGATGSSGSAYRALRGEEEVNAVDKMRKNVGSVIESYGKNMADIFQRGKDGRILFDEETGDPAFHATVKDAEKEAALNIRLAELIKLSETANDPDATPKEVADAKRGMDKILNLEISSWLFYYAMYGEDGVKAFEHDYNDMQAMLTENLDANDINPYSADEGGIQPPGKQEMVDRLRSMASSYRNARAVVENIHFAKGVMNKMAENDAEYQDNLSKFMSHMTYNIVREKDDLEYSINLKDKLQAWLDIYTEEAIEDDTGLQRQRKYIEAELVEVLNDIKKGRKIYNEMAGMNTRELEAYFNEWVEEGMPREENRRKYHEGTEQIARNFNQQIKDVGDNVLAVNIPEKDDQGNIYSRMAAVSSEIQVGNDDRSLGNFIFNEVTLSGDIEIINDANERMILRKQEDGSYVVLDANDGKKIMDGARFTVLRTAREVLMQDVLPDKLKQMNDAYIQSIESFKVAVADKRSKAVEAQDALEDQLGLAQTKENKDEINARLEDVQESMNKIEEMEKSIADFIKLMENDDLDKMAERMIDTNTDKLIDLVEARRKEASDILFQVHNQHFIGKTEFDPNNLQKSYEDMDAVEDASAEATAQLIEAGKALEVARLQNQFDDYQEGKEAMALELAKHYAVLRKSDFDKMTAVTKQNLTYPDPIDLDLSNINREDMEIIDLTDGIKPIDDLQTQFFGWQSFLKLNYSYRELEERMRIVGTGGLDNHERAMLALRDFIYNELGTKEFPGSELEAYAVSISNIADIPELVGYSEEDLRDLLSAINFYVGTEDEYGGEKGKPVYITPNDSPADSESSRKFKSAANLDIMVLMEIDKKTGKRKPLKRNGQWLYSYLGNFKSPFKQTPTGFSKFGFDKLEEVIKDTEQREKFKAEQANAYLNFRREVGLQPQRLVFNKIDVGVPLEGPSWGSGSEFASKNNVSNNSIVIAVNPLTEKDEKGRQEFKTPDGITYTGYRGMANVRVGDNMFPIKQPMLSESSTIMKEVVDLITYISLESSRLGDEKTDAKRLLNIKNARAQLSEYIFLQYKDDPVGKAHNFYITDDHILILGTQAEIDLKQVEDPDTQRDYIEKAIDLVAYDKTVAFDRDRVRSSGNNYTRYRVVGSGASIKLQRNQTKMSYAEYMLSQPGMGVYGFSSNTINRSATMEFTEDDRKFFADKPADTKSSNEVKNGTYTIPVTYDANGASNRSKKRAAEFASLIQGNALTVEFSENGADTGNLALDAIFDSLPRTTADEFLSALNLKIARYGLNASGLFSPVQDLVEETEEEGVKWLANEIEKLPEGHSLKGKDVAKLYERWHKRYKSRESSYASFRAYVEERISLSGSGLNMENVDQAYQILEDQTHIDWLLETFNGLGVEPAKLKRKVAARTVNGLKVLYNQRGTAPGWQYHEGFHAATQFFMTEAERTALYDEWRKDNKSDLADKAVDEKLAEEFREWMLDGNAIKGKKKSWFNKLIDIIIEFFGLKSTKKQFFEDIRNGVYAKAQPVSDKIQFTDTEYLNMEILGMDNEQVIPAINYLNQRVLSSMVTINVAPDRTIVNAKKIKEFDFNTRVYNTLYDDLLDEYEDNGENSFIGTFFDSEEEFEDSWDSIVDAHQTQLIGLGVDVIREDEEEISDDGEEGIQIQKQKRDNPNVMKSLENNVKLTLLMIPEFGKDRKPVVTDYHGISYTSFDSLNKMATTLSRVLVNVSEKDFMGTLKRLGFDPNGGYGIFPQLGYLYELLDGENENPTDKWMIDLRHGMYSALHKSLITTATASFANGRATIQDHYAKQALYGLKSRWRSAVNQAKGGIFSTKGVVDLKKPLLELDGGQRDVTYVASAIDSFLQTPSSYQREKAQLIGDLFEAFEIPIDLPSKENFVDLILIKEPGSINAVLQVFKTVLEETAKFAVLYGTVNKTKMTIPRNRFLGQASVMSISRARTTEGFQRSIDTLASYAVHLGYGANSMYMGEGKMLNAYRYPQPVAETFSLLARVANEKSTSEKNAMLAEESLLPYDRATVGSVHTIGSKIIDLLYKDSWSDLPLQQISHIQDFNGYTNEIASVKSADLFLLATASAAFKGSMILPKTGDRDNIWMKPAPELFSEKNYNTMYINFQTAMSGYLKSDIYAAINQAMKIGQTPYKNYSNSKKAQPVNRHLLNILFKHSDTLDARNMANPYKETINTLRKLNSLEGDLDQILPGDTLNEKASRITQNLLTPEFIQGFVNFFMIEEQKSLLKKHPALLNDNSDLVNAMKDAFKRGVGDKNYENEVELSNEESGRFSDSLISRITRFYLMRQNMSIIEASKVFFTDSGFLKDGTQALKRFHGADSTVLTIPSGDRVNREMLNKWPSLTQLLNNEAATDMVDVLVVKDSGAYMSEGFVKLLDTIREDMENAQKEGDNTKDHFQTVLDAYANPAEIEGTDGGSKSTLDFYRRVKLQHGFWSPESEMFYQYQMQDYIMKLIDINEHIKRDGLPEEALRKLDGQVIDEALFMRLFSNQLPDGMEEMPVMPMYEGEYIKINRLNNVAIKPIKPKGFDRASIYQFGGKQQMLNTTLVNYDKHSISPIIPSEHFIESDKLYAQPSEFYATLDYLNDNIALRYHPTAIKIDAEQPTTMHALHTPEDKATKTKRHIRSLGIQVPEPPKRSVNSTNSKQQTNLQVIDQFGLELSGDEKTFIDMSTDQAIVESRNEFYNIMNGISYNRALNEFGKLGLRPENLHRSSTIPFDDIKVRFDKETFKLRLKGLRRAKHIDTNTYDNTLHAIEKYDDLTILPTSDGAIRSIMSVLKKAGISPKLHGFYGVQISDGFNNDNSQLVGDIIAGNEENQEVVGLDGSLKMFEKQENGTYSGMEVRIPIPPTYHRWIHTKYKPKKGDPEYHKNPQVNIRTAYLRFKKDFEAGTVERKEMYKGFTIRVPHDGRHQSAHIKVKQYYMPWESYGVRVPTAAVKMFGFDFDYDKLHVFLFRPTYDNFTGEMTFPQYAGVKDNKQIAKQLLSSPADLHRVLEEYSLRGDAATAVVEEFNQLHADYESGRIKELAHMSYEEYMTQAILTEDGSASGYDKFKSRLASIENQIAELKRKLDSMPEGKERHALGQERRRLIEASWSWYGILYNNPKYIEYQNANKNAKEQINKMLVNIIDELRVSVDSADFLASNAELENRLLQLRISMFEQNEEVIKEAMLPTDPAQVFTESAKEYLKSAEPVDLKYFYSGANLASSYKQVVDKARLIGVYAVQGIFHGKLQRNPNKLQIANVVIPFTSGTKQVDVPAGQLPKTVGGHVIDESGKPITVTRGAMLNAALDFLATIEVKDLPLTLDTSTFFEIFTMFASEIGQQGPMSFNNIMDLMVSYPAKLATLTRNNLYNTLYNMGVSDEIIDEFYYSVNNTYPTQEQRESLTFGEAIKTYLLSVYGSSARSVKGQRLTLNDMFYRINEYQMSSKDRADMKTYYVDGIRSRLASIAGDDVNISKMHTLDVNLLKKEGLRGKASDNINTLVQAMIDSKTNGTGQIFAFVLDLLNIYGRLSNPMFTFASIMRTESQTGVSTLADLQNYIGKLDQVSGNSEDNILSYFPNADLVLETSSERSYPDIYSAAHKAISGELQTDRFYTPTLKGEVRNFYTSKKYFGGNRAAEKYMFDRMLMYGSYMKEMQFTSGIPIMPWYNRKRERNNENNIYNTFNRIPSDIIEGNNLLKSLNPRQFVDNIFGGERENVGFDIDFITSIPDRSKLYHDYDTLRSVKNQDVQDVLDFLLVEAIIETMLGRTMKYGWLIRQSDMLDILDQSVEKFSDNKKLLHTEDALAPHMDNIVMANYYNLTEYVRMADAFPEIELTEDNADIGGGTKPAVITRIMNIPARRIYTGRKFSHVRRKYMRVDVPLYQLIGLKHPNQVNDIKPENQIMEWYAGYLKDMLTNNKVTLIYRGDNSKRGETQGIDTYELMAVPQYLGSNDIVFNETKTESSEIERRRHINSFLVSAYMLRTAFHDAKKGIISPLLFYNSDESVRTTEQRMYDLVEATNEVTLRKLEESQDSRVRALGESFEKMLKDNTLTPMDVYLTAQKYIENGDVTPMGELFDIFDGVIDDKIVRANKSRSAAQNAEQLKKVQTTVDQIVEKWDTNFPDLTHWSTIMRTHAAVAIANGTLKDVKCEL